MKKFWDQLLQFFGFGEKPQSARELADSLMGWIGSQERLDESRTQAFQALQKNEISLEERRKHPYEGTIHSDCIKVDAALTQYYADEMSRRFGDANFLLNLFDNGISTVLSSATPQKIESAIEGKIAQSNPFVTQLKDNLTRAKHDLHIFKGANGLQQDAQSVDVSNSLYIILAVAIFEAIANIFFLRENTSTPKAAFLSVAVAAINVGANVWFGIRYRDKNHIDEKISKAGSTYKIYAFLTIFFLNAMIAVFRYVSQEVSVQNSSIFLFESTVLLAIGVILGIAAFNKGYSLDDPYPGYGPLHRKVQDLETQWQFILDQHADFCESTKKTALSTHASTRERIQGARNQLMEALPDLARYVNQWAAQRRQLNQSFAQLQQMFKTTISSNLLGENKYPISIEDLQPNTQLEHYQRQLDSLLGRKDQINTAVDALNEQIDASENRLSDWVKGDLARELFRWPN